MSKILTAAVMAMIAALLLVFAAFPASGATTGITWTRTGDLPIPVTQNGFVEAQGYLFSIGGTNDDGPPTDTVYRGAVAGDGHVTWSDAGNPLPVAYGTVTAASDGTHVFVLAGDIAGGQTAQVYVSTVDGSGGMTAWADGKTVALPEAHSNAMAEVVGDFIYVIGGIDLASGGRDEVYYNRIQADGSLQFNPWLTGPDLPQARYWHAATVVDDHIYVSGGGPGGGGSNVVWRGDVNTITGAIASPWVPVASLPVNRNQHAMAARDMKLYVIAGGLSANPPQTDTVYSIAVDGAGDTIGAWKLEANPYGEPNHLVGDPALTLNGRIYTLGGNYDQGSGNSRRTYFTNTFEVTLQSGTDGAGGPGNLCDADPLVTFTSASKVIPVNAIIGDGSTSDVCNGPHNSAGSATSQSVTTNSGSDLYGTFETTFSLPVGFQVPVLQMQVSVDDVVVVSLNGTEIATACLNDGGSPDKITTSNASLFHAGVNTLEFYVVNNRFGCGLTPVGRGGIEQMYIEFDGTVSFKAQPITPQTSWLTVIKHVVNDHGGTASPGNWNMDITGTDVSPNSFPGQSGGGVTVTLDAGAYSVTESGGPSGYAASFSAGCSGTIGIGESKTCTITNNDIQPSLTIIKTVINDHGGTAGPGAWTMGITGTDVSSNNFPGQGSPGVKVGLDAGAYSVTESGGPSGYAASFSAGCSGTIAIGESKTCTITNDDIQPSLTVIKNVVNDHGGTALPGAWTMDITGIGVSPNNFPGQGSPGVKVGLDAGAYNVTESGGPSGYAASFSAGCAGTIAIGESKTCTITNDDESPPPTPIGGFGIFTDATGTPPGIGNSDHGLAPPWVAPTGAFIVAFIVGAGLWYVRRRWPI